MSQGLTKVLKDSEWLIFEKASEFKIRDNDIRIAELKVKMHIHTEKPDPIYKQKLTGLENVNLEMKRKMVIYRANQDEWNSYKSEFNHDLDKLGQALTDLMVDNEKSSQTLTGI